MTMRFDPNTYATVQERRKQFLADHPNGIILTDAITDVSDFTHAVVQARVWRDRATANPALPDASGIASEWFVEYGTEEARRMQANTTSWWENAATSAIGRALVNLGYDMNKEAPSREEMAKVQRLEGARPSGPARNGNGSVSSGSSAAPPSSGPGSAEPATTRQLRYLQAVAREAGMVDSTALDERAMAEFGVVAAALSRRDASTLIDLLQTQSGGADVPGTPAPNGLREQVKNGRESAPPSAGPGANAPADAPSPKQWSYLDSLMRDTNTDKGTLDEIARARYAVDTSALDKRQLSELIDGLKAVKEGQQTIEALYPASNTAGVGVSAADEPSPWDAAPPPEEPF